jgi:hypothetical protein
MDLEILEYGWEALHDLVLTEEAKTQGLGRMTLERWTELQGQLVETELIPEGKVAPANAFTSVFLNSSSGGHGGPELRPEPQ